MGQIPDKNGWHIGAAVATADGYFRWHYCAEADRDTLVRDTKQARAEHEASCKRQAAQAKRAAAREARKRSLAGLATHRREKRLEREVLKC